jgi:tetratricopeptide (TPR) repeat protein
MKKISILLFVLALSSTLLAQDAMQKAFEKSYEQEKSGNYAAAVQSILAVYNPRNYECNIRIGYLKYLAGSYTESVTYYQKAIDIMPYAIEPRMGYVYPAAALNKWDDVVTQYNAILKIDSKNSQVNYRLGVIYYNKKKYAQAYSLFEKVVNLYPFDYDGLIMYAWCNYRVGKLQQARVLFNKVLLLSPDDKSAMEGLALIK